MAVVHPVPSAISAVLVASLALVAGGEPVVAGWVVDLDSAGGAKATDSPGPGLRCRRGGMVS